MSNGIYEIFVRERPGGEYEHVGDIEAPDPQAALFFAKEHMLRRESVVGLWVVDRDDIVEASWPLGVLNSGSTKRYRRTPGREGRKPDAFAEGAELDFDVDE